MHSLLSMYPLLSLMSVACNYPRSLLSRSRVAKVSLIAQVCSAMTLVLAAWCRCNCARTSPSAFARVEVNLCWKANRMSLVRLASLVTYSVDAQIFRQMSWKRASNCAYHYYWLRRMKSKSFYNQESWLCNCEERALSCYKELIIWLIIQQKLYIMQVVKEFFTAITKAIHNKTQFAIEHLNKQIQLWEEQRNNSRTDEHMNKQVQLWEDQGNNSHTDEHLNKQIQLLEEQGNNSHTDEHSMQAQLVTHTNAQFEVPFMKQLDEIKQSKEQNENLAPVSFHSTQHSKGSLQQQREWILKQIAKLDEEAARIRGDGGEDLLLKRRLKIVEEEQAKKNAQHMIKALQAEKKAMEEKKRRNFQKSVSNLQKEEQARREHMKDELQAMKREKRLAIERRLEEEKRKREERRLMDKQSNVLLAQIKKEEPKEEEKTPIKRQKKESVIKRAVNIAEIEEHERRYQAMKEELAGSKRKEQVVQVKKYEKNKWIERIQNQEKIMREEEKIKQGFAKAQLEKRLKYGEIVKNSFVAKRTDGEQSKQRKEQSLTKYQQKQSFSKEPHNKQMFSKQQREQLENKRIKEQLLIEKKRNKMQKQLKQSTKSNKGMNLEVKEQDIQREESNQYIQKYTQELLPQIYPNVPKTPETRLPKISRDASRNQMKQKAITGQNYRKKKIQKQDSEEDMAKKLKEQQMRKQTKERLQKLQSHSIEKGVSTKPKYENYLGHIKIKKSQGKQWLKIIDDNRMSKQEKYNQMLRQANNLEKKAKMREQLTKQGNDEAVNLYIGSIQAKLAMLEKF